MKLKHLLLGLALIAPSIISADDNGTPPSNGVTIPLYPKRPIKYRPKAPSKQSVTATYANGILTVIFAIEEGNANITLTDETSQNVYSDTFDTAEAFAVNVGETSALSIEIVTENDNTYYGTIE